MSLTEVKKKKDLHLTEEWWQKWQNIEDPKTWAKHGGEFVTAPLEQTKEAIEISKKLYKELLVEKEQERK